MRDLQKLETRLAYAMPIAAAGPIVWMFASSISQGVMPILDSRLLPLYFISIFAPIILYTVLGVIGLYAAKRDSVLLTVLLACLLIPILLFSGFLLLTHFVWTGFHSLKLYGPAPVVSVVAVAIGIASRVTSRR